MGFQLSKPIKSSIKNSKAIPVEAKRTNQNLGFGTNKETNKIICPSKGKRIKGCKKISGESLILNNKSNSISPINSLSFPHSKYPMNDERNKPNMIFLNRDKVLDLKDKVNHFVI